jgi:Tfp pilus assembly protein PilW
MVPRSSFAKSQAPAEPAAFSLVELMASVAAMGIVLSGVFTLLYQSQKHFQSSTVTSESNQSARGALEVMMQEIGQAGINPRSRAEKLPPQL